MVAFAVMWCLQRVPNLAKCEVRRVIRFLWVTAAKHRQLVSVYGEDVMDRQSGVVNLKR